MTPASGPVCVTGASGFIALHLVGQLLEKGYMVVGTVRSQSDARKMAPLLDLQRKYGDARLRIQGGVDCLKAETFDAAVAGCVGVFHTASPFTFASQDPLKDLVPSAVEGTVACLTAAARSGTVRRVVVTSSFASIMNVPAYPADYKYSDSDWNSTSRPDEHGKLPEPVPAQGYRYSKLMAEKAAWEFAAESSCPFDVCAVNPPMVIGRNLNQPSSADDLNQSSSTVRKILLGEQAPNPNSVAWVDVADVASAHAAVYEAPSAGGKRFLCGCGDVPLWTEIAEMIKEMYPAYPVQTAAPAGGAGVKLGVDCSRLQALGVTFRPIKEVLKAQCDSLIELGLAPLPEKL